MQRTIAHGYTLWWKLTASLTNHDNTIQFDDGKIHHLTSQTLPHLANIDHDYQQYGTAYCQSCLISAKDIISYLVDLLQNETFPVLIMQGGKETCSNTSCSCNYMLLCLLNKTNGVISDSTDMHLHQSAINHINIHGDWSQDQITSHNMTWYYGHCSMRMA